MNLFWGVTPLPWKHGSSPEEMVAGAEQALLRRGEVVAGDIIAVTAGTRMHSGATNFLRLQVVGSEQTGGAERRKAPRLKPPPELRRR